ncbi:MAG: hypothetical protein O3C40_26435, partial [Planctomycetota bacterium]|nr:hypothetical protein [Planctomycetota bacterium]
GLFGRDSRDYSGRAQALRYRSSTETPEGLRPAAKKSFTALLVGASAIVAMSLADFGTANDLMPGICIYLPFLGGGVWLVAKIFVWTRGWRLVPPHGASEFPKLRIWHLL